MSDASERTKRHFSSYPLRHYDNGQIILFANENPSTVWFLESGKVRKYDVSPKGNELVVNVFRPGALFPMSWAVASIPNRYFYRAETDTEMRIIPTTDVLNYFASDASIAIDTLQRVYRDIENMQERIVYLMSATAARRLMYELLVECRRFGIRQPDGSHIVPIREVDLAGRSGLSRETVSREFHKLKKRQLVSLDKEGVRVFSMHDLETEIGAIP